MTNSQPAVFFDRDGVLNHDYGFVSRPNQFEWVDGAIKLISHLNSSNIYVIVVTNQSGIARGYFTESDVIDLHKWMNKELAKESAYIDAFYYCPHHPNGSLEKYSFRCSCRKPEPGLIVNALNERQIDVPKSILIGDKLRDLDAAKKIGLRGFLFKEQNLFDFFINEVKSI